MCIKKNSEFCRVSYFSYTDKTYVKEKKIRLSSKGQAHVCVFTKINNDFGSYMYAYLTFSELNYLHLWRKLIRE